MLIVEGKEIELDKDGFLQHASTWTNAIGEALAAQKGIQLEAPHWEIIQATRNFYFLYDMSPNQVPFVKHIRATLGENKGNSRYLMHLFPGSPAKLAALIAGLPKPSHCF